MIRFIRWTAYERASSARIRAMTRDSVNVEAPELRLDPEVFAEGFDWSSIFSDGGPVEVEIGIGKGRFLLGAAERRPETNHLGIEWANKYLRVAEARAVRRGITNVRFVRDDAKELIRRFPPSSVTACYVFYPDPWPKKRHHKRRFVQLETLDQLARTLLPDGTLHIATDHADYWGVIEPHVDRHREFERMAEFGGADFPAPIDEPLTNFEAKYLTQGRSRFRGSWRRVC